MKSRNRRNCAATTASSRVDLAIHDQKQPDGTTRYCYLTPDGKAVADIAAQARRSARHPISKTISSIYAATPAVDPPTLKRRLPRRSALSKKKRRSVQQRRDDAGVDQPALPRPDRAAGLPPGRRAQDLDPARRPAVRISLSHSRRRAARPLLVSPAHSRLQQGAGARRRFRRADRRRHRAGRSRRWRVCPSACW